VERLAEATGGQQWVGRTAGKRGALTAQGSEPKGVQTAIETQKQTAAPTAVPRERVLGFDIARALAILGMVVVHFSLVMATDRSGPAWLNEVLGFLDGRAAAAFVVLAGVGLTLLSQQAVHGGDSHAIARVRRVLSRRGCSCSPSGSSTCGSGQGTSSASTACRCCWLPG
jgi:hypothetical protein